MARKTTTDQRIPRNKNNTTSRRERATGRPRTGGTSTRAAGAPTRKPGRAPSPLKEFYKRYRKEIILIRTGAILLFIIFFGVWFFTHKNAYEVYINGSALAGTIKQDKKTSEADIMKLAVAKMTETVGANVQILDTLSFKPVHESKKNIISEEALLASLTQKLQYKVEASQIQVDGIGMAIVANAAEAKSILDNIIQSYIQEGTNIVEKDFVETVNYVSVFVDPDEIITSEKAYQILTQKRDVAQLYTVVNGDSVYGIALAHGLTQEDIYTLNPDLDPGSYLKIGQQITLTLPEPIISVRTVEEITYTDVVEKTQITQENPNEPVTYSKVRQQGKNGQKEVKAQIIRINGFQVDQVDVDYTITIEPVDEIIEVGTRNR